MNISIWEKMNIFDKGVRKCGDFGDVPKLQMCIKGQVHKLMGHTVTACYNKQTFQADVCLPFFFFFDK